MISRELSRSADTEVTASTAVDAALLKMEGCKGKDRWEEPCAVKVGRALGVSHVVSGALGGLGKTFIVQMRLVDVKRAVVTRSLEETHFGGSATLNVMVSKMIERLFDRPEKKPSWYTRWWIWAAAGVVVAASVIVPVLVIKDDDPFENVPLP